MELGQLRWRCRRGMRELDAALVAYLDHHYTDADDDEQQAFHHLLALPDPELMQYVSKGRSSLTTAAERDEPDPKLGECLDAILTKIRTSLTP